MFDLSGRRALVTGAGAGIGRAIALALAGAGADVIVHYGRSAGPAGEVAAAIAAMGRTSTAIGADVTDPAAVDRLVRESVDLLGGLDVLVCNAGGLLARVSLGDMTDTHFDAVLDVNLTSTFRCVRAALPALHASGSGRIITMASLAAHNGGGPGSTAYAAAKAGIIALTKGLAKEYGPAGITANTLAPGFIGETAFHATFTPIETQRATIAGLPVRRAGAPNDVAAAAVFLAARESGFVTGTTIDIDGGAYPR
jgi:3-oxoacyl-[acyl-carrier protein] reductase